MTRALALRGHVGADVLVRPEAFIVTDLKTKSLPATKVCRNCKVTKPLSAFSKHRLAKDGHRKDCALCVKLDRADRKREPTPAQIARAKELAARPERRARNRAAVRDWSERNPLAARARSILRRAIRKGEITPPATCQIEGCDVGQVVGHHADYLRPADVLFLCGRHHRRLHNGTALALKAGVRRHLKRLPRRTTR